MVLHQCLGLRRLSGQSIVEFAIVMTILVPLLLSIPAISKLFEIQNKATQLARLSAWQPHDNRGESGNSDRTLIFQSAVLSDAQTASAGSSTDADDVVWDPMVVAEDPLIASIDVQFSEVDTQLSGWMAGMNAATTMVKLTGFPLQSKNMEAHRVALAAKTPAFLVRWLSLESEDLNFNYQLSLFSDNWRISDDAQQVKAVASLTPASLLPSDSIQSFLTLTTSFMPWASAWKSLQIGRIDTQIIPDQYQLKVKP